MATKSKGKSKPKKKGKEQAAASSPQTETQAAPAADSFSLGKNTQAVRLTPDQIVMPPKHLIVRENNGSLDELKASLKSDGQLQNLVVRPAAKKPGKFELLCGHRRFAALTEIGMKQILAVIRTDLAEDADALGVVMSENSPDGRSNLSPVEQARVFSRMHESFGGDSGAAAKVARACATTADNVRRTMQLLDAPKSVLDRLNAGDISKDTVLAFQKISDPRVAKTVEKAIAAGDVETRPEVETLASQVVKEMQDEGKEVEEPTDKRKKAAGVASVWRSRKDVNTLYDDLLWMYGVATGEIDDASAEYADIVGNEEAATGIAIQINMLAWMMGVVDDPSNTEAKAFTTLLKREVKRVLADYGEDVDAEESEEPEEPKASKKSSGKKSSKKDKAEETEEADDEDAEQSDDDVPAFDDNDD